MKISDSESRSALSYSLQPHGLYSLRNSPGQNTGVVSLSLLQGIFPTQGSNPGLLHCRQDSLPVEPLGKPWFDRNKYLREKNPTTWCSNFPKGSVLVVRRLKMVYCPSPKYLFYRQRNWRSKRWSQRTQTSKWKALDSKSRLLAPKTEIPQFHYSVRKLNAVVEECGSGVKMN